jgi:predicted phage replisome organizer
MAEVKWIKIVTDIFDDEKILLIESLPESDSLIVIWFKLLCLAGKQNNSGVFMMNNKIPYTEEMLAAIFRRPLSTVKLALKAFEDFEMIEIVDGVITIPNWGKHQSLDQLELAREQTRKRVAKHRARQKEILLGTGATEKNCVYCGEKATTIDHVIPKTLGGLDTKDNIVPCCLSCNQQKNDHELGRFLNDRLVMNEKVDIESIQNNDILREFVTFDYSINKFVTLRNVTDRYEVTQSNADRIDKDIDKDIDKEKDIKKKNTNTKHKYGEYNHVLLTDNEYKKLEEQYGSSNLQTIITYLDEYLEMKGTKYKSHYMVIKKWGAEAALKKEREQTAFFFKSFLES